MLTMALGGLWHGAAWNYVLWGVYQGAIQILYKVFGFATTGDLEERKRFTHLSVSSPMINCRNSPTRTCRFLSKNKGHSLW
jgi:D-alanyl-lipoteichoic acid acyltransferase DltB (MBOAT superfamily)